MPRTTPEADAARAERQKAQQARRATLQGREADSYTDRSNYDRYISLGTMGSLTPKIMHASAPDHRSRDDKFLHHHL